MSKDVVDPPTPAEGFWIVIAIRQADCDETEVNHTNYGPFKTEREADGWINDYPDDPELLEMYAEFVNQVAPGGRLAIDLVKS